MLICLLIKIGLTPSGSISSECSVTISVLFSEQMRHLKGKKMPFQKSIEKYQMRFKLQICRLYRCSP